MKNTIRLTFAALAASAALVGGVAAQATAAPAADGVAAKRALDTIAPAPTDAADVIAGIDAANAVLKKLGITPFTPTIGACTDFTFPLAVGGAVAGPMTPVLGDLTIGSIDLNAVRKGEILYGFVPAGLFDDTADKSGMRVAWFNVNTMKGSIGDPMQGLSDTILGAIRDRAVKEGILPAVVDLAIAPLKLALSGLPANGVRGGLVDTGSGTVLSAIYGTVAKGDATCYFFPSLGIATAG